MRSRSRLITRGLKAEDFKCDLFVDEKLICDDCGVEMKYALQIIGKRAFCKECAPWYKEQAENDKKLIEQDLLRSWKMGTAEQEIAALGLEADKLSAMGISPPRKAIEEIEAELDYGERDYWD